MKTKRTKRKTSKSSGANTPKPAWKEYKCTTASKRMQFINLCAKYIVDQMKQESKIKKHVPENNIQDKGKGKTKLLLKSPQTTLHHTNWFHKKLYRKENIFYSCCICKKQIDSQNINYIHHSHLSRQFSPLCGQCNQCTYKK